MQLTALDKHGVTWHRLIDPGNEEVDEIAQSLGLHPLAVEDTRTGRQQPKVQRFGDQLFIVLWDLLESERGERLAVGEVFLFLGDGWLVTIQQTNDGKPTDLEAILAAERQDIGHGAVAAAYRVMEDVVARYAAAAAGIEVELEQLENDVFDPAVQEDVRRIFIARQNIGRISRAVASLSASLEATRDHLEDLAVDREAIAPYFRGLMDDIAGTAALTADQSAALDAIVSSHESNVSMQQNQDMRTISAFAALLAVPTLVAGLYGMNFKNIPLVQWQGGWAVIACAVIAIDLFVYWLFKRRKWL